MADKNISSNAPYLLARTPVLESGLTSPRILIVDDEPRLLQSLSELLSQKGLTISTASCGRDAVRLLVENTFDLVLLDLHLPDMSGHEIMDIIKAMNIDVRIIIISGSKSVDSVVGAIQRGAHDYLQKPYAKEELHKKIDNAIAQRRLELQNSLISKQLHHSEKLYRQLVDNSPDIIYILDDKGNITFVNNRLYAILGIVPEDVVGKHFSTIVHHNDIDRANYAFNSQSIEDDSTTQIELRLLDYSGHEHEQRIFDHTLTTIELNAATLQAMGIAHQSARKWNTYCIARDVTQSKQDKALIQYQTHHDTLTALPNRTLFKEQLSLAIIQAKRTHSHIVVMFINLDRFKLVNDSLGHIKGDELLKQVANRLKAEILPSDTLSRLGGDEFALILPESQRTAEEIAESVLGSLHQLFELDKKKVHITASIGVSVYPKDATSSDELMRYADVAMNHVKTQGKNAYSFYNDTMLDSPQEKIALEISLMAAIENNELEMYYQPIVDVTKNKITGAEALMRWNHPEKGLISAGAFIPLAEDSGLILPLSDWMLEAVSKNRKDSLALDIDNNIHISINISPQYLDRGDFHEKIRNALAHHEISADNFNIEITENICIRNPQYAIDQLNKLTELGVGVSIDDFGTGYSSLSYLHKFPIHTIKVDQAFVREITDEAGHYPVVLSIISIAHGLGLNVIAEGVETEAQRNYLHKAGCNLMQGYFLHRPMPVGQMRLLLEAQAKINKRFSD